jgi:hypothetical protein
MVVESVKAGDWNLMVARKQMKKEEGSGDKIYLSKTCPH